MSLDAVEDGDGRLLAATSARQVAEHLGVSPASAAKAVGRLRSLGLVTHDRQPGPGGRFGLSLYRLVPPPGVEVVGTADRSRADAPRAGAPRVESPDTAPPRAAEEHMAAEVRAATKAEGATRPTRSVRRAGPVRDHHQLDLLAPAALDPAPNATPPPTPTPTTTNHTHNQSPNQPNQPSSTPTSNNPNPTRGRHLPALSSRRRVGGALSDADHYRTA